ncbi:hypothetical protein Hprae_0297 [Halanaerobium praevalens DSM 2228]|uniref:Uncharacterized protein n=1 Tax=Halanaerobium praevalens (strain ATCC 33744 / DSM 2228 / GSL) TaxID=572479 RepID=E3DN48_HALPG|nr:hypothetical protein Hprae_0297 [Halanaerobium praevalens DSM 2228]
MKSIFLLCLVVFLFSIIYFNVCAQNIKTVVVVDFTNDTGYSLLDIGGKRS